VGEATLVAGKQTGGRTPYKPRGWLPPGDRVWLQLAAAAGYHMAPTRWMPPTRTARNRPRNDPNHTVGNGYVYKSKEGRKARGAAARTKYREGPCKPDGAGP